MKTYRGERIAGKVFVTVDGVPLPERQDLQNHSPDGFEWGYAGSGPAQLALALLADATGDDARALSLYQGFKFCHVTSFDHDGWEMTEAAIKVWVDSQREYQLDLGDA